MEKITLTKQELIEKIASNVIQVRPNDKYPGANRKLKVQPGVIELMLKGIGYKTINLGIDVSANRILETTINHNVACIGLSALYTPVNGEMEHVINAFELAGIRGEIKVLIGGGATSAQFAQRIGADAYCGDAFQAINALKRMDNWSGFAGAALN
jgi:cobalamin-dependent methionine synthase I